MEIVRELMGTGMEWEVFKFTDLAYERLVRRRPKRPPLMEEGPAVLNVCPGCRTPVYWFCGRRWVFEIEPASRRYCGVCIGEKKRWFRYDSRIYETTDFFCVSCFFSEASCLCDSDENSVPSGRSLFEILDTDQGIENEMIARFGRVMSMSQYMIMCMLDESPNRRTADLIEWLAMTR